MFSFLKKKKIHNTEVKAFDSALKAINVFILLSEWEKAKKALKEIECKEKKSLDIILKKLDDINDDEGVNQKEKVKLAKDFKNKKKRLDKLKHILERKEESYKIKSDNERFKIRFKKIKEEILTLTGNKKNNDALGLLQKFLEENGENTSVVRFYNKEKKHILKNIEKTKKQHDLKMKNNTKYEALKLIGATINIEEEKVKGKTFFEEIKIKINFYKTIKEKIRKKKLLDEINILIEEDSKIKQDMATRKLANIHKGLVKELTNDKILGYDMYGKILGADKISGDTFGIVEDNKKYNFFLGDATGHGIRAGFIITLLTRLFNKYVKNSDLGKLAYEINNGLKQDLKSRNFITGVFFEILKTDNKVIKFVGMGHEPMLVFRKKTNTIEKIIPGGLAAGIRLIKNIDDIKVRDILLEDGDVLIIYSDGIVENKDLQGDFYGLNRLIDSFNHICKLKNNINDIYQYLINDIEKFKGTSQFSDDASVLLVKRNIRKDIVSESSEYLKKLQIKEGLNKKDIKKLKGKTIEDIDEELKNIRKVKEIKRIVKILDSLYYTGEILKLKQESIRFIKEGYIDKKINFYLKKAIDNEKAYKIEQKNQKIVNRYNVLSELLRKGDYETVIREAEDVISKDGNI